MISTHLTFWFWMYCRICASVWSLTVATKYDRFQRWPPIVSSLSLGISLKNSLADTPFNDLIIVGIECCGVQSINKWTWSKSVLISEMVKPKSFATWCRRAFNLSSILIFNAPYDGIIHTLYLAWLLPYVPPQAYDNRCRWIWRE